MKKSLLTVFLMVLLSVTMFADGGKKFGKEVTLKEKTNISTILDEPAKFEGKSVLIEGTVVNVCEKRGCWIEVASEEGYGTIKVKVKDGEIVFPMEAKGKKAVVQGEVYSLVPAVQEKHSHEGHDEESKAECTDEKKVDGEKEAAGCGGCGSSKEVKKVYQIKGQGAVIDL